MSDSVYHSGMRELQDRFDTRRLADRLDERLGRRVLRDEDRAFIESRTMFFLATSDAEGRPDCSYKGGDAGFVRVIAPDQLEFPSYDGNGQFRSLGNLLANPAVGLLFIDFDSPKRLRVNGRASVLVDADALARHHGAQLVVRVRTDRIFPNCPRYIHRSSGIEPSADVPRPGHEPPPAAWKSMPMVADLMPAPGGAAPVR
ncbi:MAG TPA: pyridoxamine 5'-phosphate oxidase family protein [Burkholderiaceae bacterium]|nr:pyridoxamine 5'-phosphate oxidase family protein [Burkholderiaceae bacterium]